MTTDQRRAIEELCEQEAGLTSWELDFIESLSQRPETYRMSERQTEQLQRIADKFCLGIDCEE